MARKHYNLPPLNALAAFEAAARHGGFKRAAAELNVTPGAVSHQIKALEQEIGCALFLRTPGGATLTAEGRDLAAVLGRSFSQTAGVLDRLRQRGSRRGVRIGATTAMASLWLMPRISRFWREHPDIRVSQHASDLEASPHQPHLDLRIRYGDGHWPGEEARLLFEDEIAPLCSPSFALGREEMDLDALAAAPLIHLEDVDEGWVTWRQWFDALGHESPIDPGVSVNSYTIALQIAQDSNGIALGWLRLVAPLLEQGLLRPIGTKRLRSPGSFFIAWHQTASLAPEAEVLRDWLLADAKG